MSISWVGPKLHPFSIIEELSRGENLLLESIPFRAVFDVNKNLEPPSNLNMLLSSLFYGLELSLPQTKLTMLSHAVVLLASFGVSCRMLFHHQGKLVVCCLDFLQPFAYGSKET